MSIIRTQGDGYGQGSDHLLGVQLFPARAGGIVFRRRHRGDYDQEIGTDFGMIHLPFLGLYLIHLAIIEVFMVSTPRSTTHIM
jgi:hypothetical protein